MEKKQQFSIWYFLAAFPLIATLQDFFSPQHAGTIPYSDFKTLLKAGKVADVSLAENAITGTLNTETLDGLLPKEQVDRLQKLGKGPHAFSTVRINDPALVAAFAEPDFDGARRGSVSWRRTAGFFAAITAPKRRA